MKLALACDHAGYTLKAHLADYLRGHGHDILDLGVDSADTPADYPDSAAALANAIRRGQAERGVLICGSGVGASIAANKFDGIYAAVCHDTYSARQGVEHDNMNVLALGARVIGVNVAETLVMAFIDGRFSNAERHRRRFGKVQQLESQLRTGE
ncbi:MAG: ribose 5-phosphate isomerase B [Anaerolineaceae bacterium]|nr:MAG: ribose 5-phosphate isomerase B [Anaerolineaceae bacterium]